MFWLALCATAFGSAVLVDLAIGQAGNRLRIPWANWFGVSATTFVILTPATAMLAVFSSGSYAITQALFVSGIVGAVVDLPLSWLRNFAANRSKGRILSEAALLILLIITLAWCANARYAAEPPQNWGALG